MEYRGTCTYLAKGNILCGLPARHVSANRKRSLFCDLHRCVHCEDTVPRKVLNKHADKCRVCYLADALAADDEEAVDVDGCAYKAGGRKCGKPSEHTSHFGAGVRFCEEHRCKQCIDGVPRKMSSGHKCMRCSRKKT